MKRSLKIALAWSFAIASLQIAPIAFAADCSPTVTSSGAYTIMKFTTVGTCTYSVPANLNRIEYLIIGGGGGGGNNAGWGGGGGSYAAGTETQSASSVITVTIGDGGAGGQTVDSPLRDGQNGSASSVAFARNTISAAGGTGGQTYWSLNTCNTGAFTSTTYSGNGGAGGAPGINANGANGAAGYSVTVTPPANFEGTNYESFAGGGGGGVTGTGSGGTGSSGGANGAASNQVGNNAAANTGGGGGGGGDMCKNGGNGGSGIVILRYLNAITYPNSTFAYPTVTGDLASRYTPLNFNGLAKTWTDISSYRNHITDVTGSPYTAITTATTAGNVASDNYAITGVKADKFLLPYTVAATYTTFYVGRYTSSTAGNRGRILSTDATTNWLSGFYYSANGVTGVAFHGSWATQNSAEPNGTAPFMGWVLSTDQQALHRSQRVNQTTVGYTGTSQTPKFGVNRYTGEESNWQVIELIVYAGTLSASDIQAVENYLYNQYFRGVNYLNLTVAAGANPQYRVPTTLTASVRSQSRVTFKVNNKPISKCVNVLSSSSSATCQWLPSVHSQQTITATANPVDSKYDSASGSASVYVVKRSSTR